jgi:ribosome-associated heat shock protein Hsp15
LRIDLFLKTVGLAKTRMAAKRLCEGQRILLDGLPVKPSREILAGEIIEIFLPTKNLRVKILEIPGQKSVAKHERSRYVELVEPA